MQEEGVFGLLGMLVWKQSKNTLVDTVLVHGIDTAPTEHDASAMNFPKKRPLEEAQEIEPKWP